MDTHSCKSVSIDLFNLPPLPDEQNKEESYMDVPYNYYIPNGKSSRLLDRTDRVEFDRETIEGNTGLKLEIPYLEYAFGTKYLIMDRVTGSHLSALTVDMLWEVVYRVFREALHCDSLEDINAMEVDLMELKDNILSIWKAKDECKTSSLGPMFIPLSPMASKKKKSTLGNIFCPPVPWHLHPSARAFSLDQVML